MSEKYDILKPLGNGSSSSVYLVRHKSLDQERAMKVYPKDHVLTSSTLTEARILKSLSHPGIPLIYDIENIDGNIYLIEEYVRGESLDQFLLHQSIISTEFYYMLIRQLCDIFHYLHSLSPSPVIYRDLKPEHMIISGEQIKLIDFNISLFLLSEDKAAEGNNLDHLGNEAFSAPENFSENTISLASDIYSIGKIMEYLSCYLEGKPSRNLRKIINRATARDPSLRFETVEELDRALAHEQTNFKKTHLVTSIAIIGGHHGCGASHLAFSLVSALNYQGISAIYLEKNPENSLQNAAEYLIGMTEKEGCYHYHFFHGLPEYGPGVKCPVPNSSIRVFDYGIFDSIRKDDLEKDRIDHLIYITDASLWNLRRAVIQTKELAELNYPVTFVCNLSHIHQARKLSKESGQSYLLYSFDPNPFRITPKKLRFFRLLQKQME